MTQKYYLRDKSHGYTLTHILKYSICLKRIYKLHGMPLKR